jgi:hypothetical protein
MYDPGEPPLMLGDQTIFSVWNDLAPHTEYNTEKLSVEVRQTVWAYNRADALGDMQFIKWVLVNKSGVDWDSTYFSIWLDPDLGQAADDLVGCDTTLGLGYTYNATNEDQNYGTPPPAQGIDFFQGPLVYNPDSTVTLPDGTVFPEREMLKMSSFVFYNNTKDPTNGNPETGGDVWNYMRSIWRNGQPITYGGRGTDPNNPRSYFMFPGDPETEQGSGWLDSEADDRRFLMTTGPFKMEAWEDKNGNGMPDLGEPGVQEIVAGIILAKGANYLNSVTKLKEVDNLAQLAYDLDFKLANAPFPPNVTVSASQNMAVLTWDEQSEFNEDGSPYESVDPIVEKALGDTVIMDDQVKVITDASYNFYGYTIYQYSDVSGSDPVKVDAWNNGGSADAIPYSGTRYKRVLVNKNSKVGKIGDPLINGKEYYFGVVAEGYLEFGAPKVLQSPPNIVTIVPNFTPGLRYQTTYNDTLDVMHEVISGPDTSVGSVLVYVVDPSKVTGLDYKVTFNADQTWNLIRSDADTVLKDQTNQTGDDAYLVVDGLMVKVAGPEAGINFNKIGVAYGAGSPTSEAYLKGWDFSGTRWISGINWGGRALFGGLDNNASFWGATDLTADQFVDVELRWAGVTDRSNTTAAGLAAASMLEDPSKWSKAVVYHRPGYAVQPTLADVPFALWDVRSNPEKRLKIAMVERADIANSLWDMGWDGSAFDQLGAREYTFLLNDDYNNGDYSQYLDGTLDGTYNNTMYAFWAGGRGSHPYLEAPWFMEIFASKVNTPNDVFTFTAPKAATQEAKDIAADINKVKVVPNPYYGYHSGEMGPFSRWVQFTFVPKNSIIRIFDLTGNMVRRIDAPDPDNSLVQWDLKNKYDLPVASGIYVYHVESPEGKKVGKLAIFAPNERLDTY